MYSPSSNDAFAQRRGIRTPPPPPPAPSRDVFIRTDVVAENLLIPTLSTPKLPRLSHRKEPKVGLRPRPSAFRSFDGPLPFTSSCSSIFEDCPSLETSFDISDDDSSSSRDEDRFFWGDDKARCVSLPASFSGEQDHGVNLRPRRSLDGFSNMIVDEFSAR